jgi:membrane protein
MPKIDLRRLTAPAARLAQDTWYAWNDHNAARLGAALAFYAILSIGPLLLIVVSVAGLAFGNAHARDDLLLQMQHLVGRDGARAIGDMLANASGQKKSLMATIVGVVTLLISASGFFGQLQAAMNVVWNVPKEQSSVMGFVNKRLLSFGMILGICLLLLFSLVVSAGIAAVTSMFGTLPALALDAGNLLLSLLVTTLLFGIIFNVLPDVDIRWRDVWVGAAFTALLFSLGKYLIGLYLGRSALSSTYGAAGSLIVLLVWIYYSSQVFLMGAEFTQVWARRMGAPLKLKRGHKAAIA